ncbi:MAG TPA: prepilin-type N-terminal cleavage/methylation domain-containing protein [Gemmatimonadales bacterium]
MNGQRGFTLIEVILALTILLVVMMMLARTTGQTVHTAATSTSQQAAIELAMDRVEQVRTNPNYDALEATYVATETGFPTLPGFTRVTRIVRTGGVGQPNDYKKVTVTVTGPGVAPAVSRSVTVAAP